MEIEILQAMNEGMYRSLLLLIESAMLFAGLVFIAGFAFYLIGLAWLAWLDWEKPQQPAQRRKQQLSKQPEPLANHRCAALRIQFFRRQSA